MPYGEGRMLKESLTLSLSPSSLHSLKALIELVKKRVDFPDASVVRTQETQADELSPTRLIRMLAIPDQTHVRTYMQSVWKRRNLISMLKKSYDAGCIRMTHFASRDTSKSFQFFFSSFLPSSFQGIPNQQHTLSD